METHPEVKETFQQRNVYGIPEDEFLRMMEMACRPRSSVAAPSKHDILSVAHMVTGMEPSKLANSGIQPSWLNDPRFSEIRAAIDKVDTTKSISTSTNHATDTTSILTTVLASKDHAAIRLALQHLILNHFSKLVMVSAEKLTSSLNRPLADFGMDSMIVADLRNWAWRELKVDVAFMVLLEGKTTLNGLVEMVWNQIDWKFFEG
jgi:hypothetical protein